MLTSVVVAMLLVACTRPAHDASLWAGAPWALRGARLPDDRATIVAWIKAAFRTNVVAKYDHEIAQGNPETGEVHAAAVVPDPEGHYCGPGCLVSTDCPRPCTARDILAAITEDDQVTKMIESLDPSAPLNFVGVAMDWSNELGLTTDSTANLFFAAPGGGWVFLISAPTPTHLQKLTERLVEPLQS